MSRKIDEINETLRKKPNSGQNVAEGYKEYQKCLSHRSENIDNDIEEYPENSNNQIKYMEKNINNLRWKDSTKKCEGLLTATASKKNSQNFNEDYVYLLEEVNKIKQKLESFEKNQETLLALTTNNSNKHLYREISNEEFSEKTDRFESAIKCKKQEVSSYFYLILLFLLNKITLFFNISSQNLLKL